jgi:predicted MFS family arabinose efflux permease
MSLSATVPLIAITNLPRVHLIVAVATSTLLMICMSGRMVPAMAMMTASIEARYRGGFMSINSSVQQFALGLAAYVSGSIMGQTSNGELNHFPLIGALSVICALSCIYFARYLKAPLQATSAVGALPAEG